ncbi:unnamed protein product [Clonostachys rosea]|uniref:FAD-binding domain-containing protein n=1 Tax=Bionectria ochroleuca TaxID=29856 RepID=A0ABY6U1U6_BIOOC|nr:unnamed protein product [Clonostachys rosea]
MGGITGYNTDTTLKETPVASNGHDGDDSVTNEYPVIIVGAGPVGLLLALQLAQSGIRSVVLEKEIRLNDAPRAIGYHGPIHKVFEDIGLYDQIIHDGMPSGGYVWRTLPIDEEVNGNKIRKLGKIIGTNNMGRRNDDGSYELGKYTIQLAQTELSKLFINAAANIGFSETLWGHQVTALDQDNTGVTVSVQTMDGVNKRFRGQFLVGCDGGRSTIRKLLGVRLHGHSWPERFLATDVLRTAPVVPEIPVHFVVDPRYWAVVTPLETVEAGKPGLWRYSMAVPARPREDDDDITNMPLTDEQVMEPEYVRSLVERQVDGTIGGDFEVVRKSLYKMHQLVASTMHRGRCFLAGDSAHINNPIGGLGLCTGLLDADALHQTLKIAFSSCKPNKGGTNGINGTGHNGNGDWGNDPRSSKAQQNSKLPAGKSVDLNALFSRYSMERRRIFQNVIHPVSSGNKLRLHVGKPEDVAREDWYLGALRRGDPEELKTIHGSLWEDWRTDMWKFQSSWLQDSKDGS